MRTLTKKDITLPKRDPHSHKGQNGKVLIIGGSKEYVGSLVLAGLAALRSGCDLVTIAAPEKVAWAVNTQAPDLITRKLPGDYLSTKHLPELKRLIAKADVVLLGNGAGRHLDTQRLMRALAKLPVRKVIDADGIKAIGVAGLENAIVTPNKPELLLFLKNSKLPPVTEPAALRSTLRTFIARGNVLLSKGPVDTIIGKDIALNKTGNAGMTRGGTGDVLAGLCAGFYAQYKDPNLAACTAAYLNGAIGDELLKKRHGTSWLASDIVADIERVRKSLPQK